MPTRCFKPIKGKAYRVTRLDACGAAVIGLRSTVATESFVKVGVTSEIEDGAEFIVKNANGDLCVNEKDCPRLKRQNLSTEFCEVDPDMVEITTGAPVLTRAGTADGNYFGETTNCDVGFTLEVWQRLAGGACSTEGDTEYLYWVWPWVTNGILADFTIEAGPLDFTVNANTKGAPSSFGDGWYDESPLSSALPAGTHYAYEITTVAPPTAECGAVELTALGS